MTLEGNLTRCIGNIICGNGRMVGDLLHDKRCQPTSILVGPMTVEQPVRKKVRI